MSRDIGGVRQFDTGLLVDAATQLNEARRNLPTASAAGEFTLRATVHGNETFVRAFNEQFNVFFRRDEHSLYCELASNDAALTYQSLVEGRRLSVFYRNAGHAGFSATYSRGSDGWMLDAGTDGAPADVAGLQSLWPLKEQPRQFIGLLPTRAAENDSRPAWKPASDLERGFSMAFTEAAKTFQRSSRHPMANACTGEFVAHSQGAAYNCDQWRTWMVQWFTETGCKQRGIQLEPVSVGTWMCDHAIERAIFPEGTRVILDPWRDAERPIWAEDDYQGRFGSIQRAEAKVF